MLYFKQLSSISSAISYKNRFLLSRSSSSDRLVGLLTFKGRKLYSLRTVNFVYLSFLRAYNGLLIHQELNEMFGFSKKNFSEFNKLYETYSLFRDLKRALSWRINENLPVVKAISKIVDNKKKKKSNSLKKYTVEYRYIKERGRAQLAIR